jgi:hypothetical protein
LTLPSAQTDWIISYSSFPQNIGIGQNFIYVSTKIDNVNYPTNSSSVFTFHPTFIYCINQPAWDNFSSIDPDGDSLSYHLIPIMDNSTACPHAPFINPVPAFPPLQSSTPIAIDSTNGSLTFTPFSVGSAMVSVRVDEFRNGILINSSTIEHVMYLVTGCTITGLENLQQNSFQFYPNPANEKLEIEWKGEEPPVGFEVIDVTGKVSVIKTFTNTGGKMQLPLENLSAGIYSLRVLTANAVFSGRFVKK